MMVEEKSTQLTISLPRFDGPFDLLISLIRRNEWSIDDLPVLEITAQFLAHIKAGINIDTDLGGEFIETASWLVLLKSRSMLPAEHEDTPSPREELRRAILDYATLTSTSEFLRDRYEGNLHPASAGAPAGRQNPVLPLSSDEAPTVQDVVEAAQRAVEAARAAASLRSTDPDGVTVEDQVRWISHRLAPIPMSTPVSTEEWFADQPTAGARIALLLALLELVRKGFLILHQSGQFGPICVKALQELPEELQLEIDIYTLSEVA
jgi:segregation and condensation protein A